MCLGRRWAALVAKREDMTRLAPQLRPCHIRLRSGGQEHYRAGARRVTGAGHCHPYDLHCPHHRRPNHRSFMPPSLPSAPAKPPEVVTVSLAGEAGSNRITPRSMRPLGTELVLSPSQLETPSLTTSREHWIIAVTRFWRRPDARVGLVGAALFRSVPRGFRSAISRPAVRLSERKNDFRVVPSP